LAEYPKKNSGFVPLLKVKVPGIPLPYVEFAIIVDGHAPDRISELVKLAGFAAF
jgi:hypothetical protein